MTDPSEMLFQMPAPSPTLACRSCGEERDRADFRIFSTAPTMWMDFCAICEHKHGTVELYRRYPAYATERVMEAVFLAARTPEKSRTGDQTRLIINKQETAAVETLEGAIRKELARRELARRRLLFYVKQLMPDYQAGWFHQDLCRRLEKFMEDVENERSPRLIVAVPPRHGKSKLGSELFPGWVLGHHPDWPIILASYAQDLPIGFSRAVRDTLADPEYQAIFPKPKIRSDAKGVEAWKTEQGGGIKAIGVGGGLTGHGGRILIADDLIKDAEAAGSEVIRKNTWDWYQMVFRSRLAPGGGILLIGTRWHWHDPSGKALEIDEEAKKNGVPDYERENWEVVSYPALAEHDEYLMQDGSIVEDAANEADVVRKLRNKGDALHPERYPVPELKKIKNTFTTANWSALYQQQPTPDEGDFFTKNDIKYRYLPVDYRANCRRFLVVDYAIGKKQRNDWTVAGVMALDHNDDLYLIDARRGRWGTADIASNIMALAVKHKPELYAGEQGAIHHAVWPSINAALKKERIYISVDESLVPIQDKETRARPLQGRMQQGKFYLSYDTEVMPDVFEIGQRELLQFPNGANDDFVDMLAWGARLAQNVSVPRIAQAKPKQGWASKLNRLARGSTSNSHMGS